MTPNKPDPTNGEEKMREWITWQKDRLLPPEAIAEYWLAKLKQSHLALLEQIIGENEGRKKNERNMARGGVVLETVGEVEAWNYAIDLINTDLRAKIEELKKQGGIVN